MNQLSLQLWAYWIQQHQLLFYNCEHVDYLATSAQSIILSMSVIWQCQFILSCSVSVNLIFLLFSFFWFKFSHSFFCYFFVWLILFLYLRFWSDLLSQTIILSCIMFLLKDFSFALFFIVFCFLVWDFNQVFCYELLFDLMQHFQKKFLFALSNFRNANFSSVCIQHMKVNLMNLIDKDLISSVNQIQSEAGNQL